MDARADAISGGGGVAAGFRGELASKMTRRQHSNGVGTGSGGQTSQTSSNNGPPPVVATKPRPLPRPAVPSNKPTVRAKPEVAAKPNKPAPAPKPAAGGPKTAGRAKGDEPRGGVSQRESRPSQQQHEKEQKRKSATLSAEQLSTLGLEGQAREERKQHFGGENGISASSSPGKRRATSVKENSGRSNAGPEPSPASRGQLTAGATAGVGRAGEARAVQKKMDAEDVEMQRQLDAELSRLAERVGDTREQQLRSYPGTGVNSSNGGNSRTHALEPREEVMTTVPSKFAVGSANGSTEWSTVPSLASGAVYANGNMARAGNDDSNNSTQNGTWAGDPEQNKSNLSSSTPENAAATATAAGAVTEQTHVVFSSSSVPRSAASPSPTGVGAGGSSSRRGSQRDRSNSSASFRQRLDSNVGKLADPAAMEEVRDWFSKLGLPQYADSFIMNGYDDLGMFG